MNRSLRALSMLLCGWALVSGCGGGVASRPGPAAAPKKVKAAPAPKPSETPLSARERQLAEELRRDVEHLSKGIGERNTDKRWELASAADWLAEQLEAAGYEVGRQGYVIDDVAAQTLEADVRGFGRNRSILLVGAHYDSAPGSPGADDNASGVAAVLALARHFAGTRPIRSLRFAFFPNEEPPHFQTPNMGSLVYAKAVSARGEDLAFMLSIESIGYFDDAAGSQRYPAAIAERYPSVGNFIAVVGNEASASLVQRVTGTLRKHASLPVVGDALPEDLDGVGWSDHWAFWQMKVPAVMITDTAPFRNPHYHRATDTSDHLDFARMARAVAGIEATLAELAGLQRVTRDPQ